MEFEKLPVELLMALAAKSHATRLKLGCVSRPLCNMLHPLNEKWRTSTMLAVKWLGYTRRVHIVFNAPLVIRIEWRTSRHLKELRLLLPTYGGSGQHLDGTYNWNLSPIDVLFKEYTPSGNPRKEEHWPMAASIEMRHNSCHLQLDTIGSSRTNFCMPNGKKELFIDFATTIRTFNQMLWVLDKSTAMKYMNQPAAIPDEEDEE